ncbi:bifunctional aspartate kinase/homoserine dehydrogenase II [Vibrio caribbeanicus]|uniref:Bifunctional aspartokinase/homoserine dehydrogenase n=1 Tax=Vibrio caribbeanicus ATCC BAA-2122 TaxID=796620 RepID=E3BIL9_9VIBR|nr:bifunctional aspartate kinase/homoserine dehydrogenase II [Vibrio caribbeanicus]EFP97056.1 bifunctional aspartate kinase II/homoserine dehydrogenase II [Vibrio caribbeanicus ATCC BAA-2122]
MISDRQLHKFGGSSLADSQCYLRVAKLIKDYSHPNDLIVVSAAGKTTNHLIAFTEAINIDGRAAHLELQGIRQYQLKLIEELTIGQEKQQLTAQLNDELSTLANLTFPLSEKVQASVLGHGEIWSCRLLAALLRQQDLPSISVDARCFLRAEAKTQPEIDWGDSLPLLNELLVQHTHQRIVITGFMAQDKQGQTVLLGRNGSDYSATMIGALASVKAVTIWSDVAGVYSADPRLVSDACLLPLLRLDEASELARLAAPVLHNRTLQPVSQSTMDLNLKCSHFPESGSTRIERVLASGRGAKIITSLDEVFIIQLHFLPQHDFNKGHSEVLTLLSRLQVEPLAYEVQTESRTLRLAYTHEVVRGALDYLQEAGIGAEIKLHEGYSMVAAVGAGVSKNASHCFGFYQQLKNSNIEFITEAVSGLSIVAVLKATETQTLVQSVHQQLFKAQKRVAVALCGKGNIGSSWLELFNQQKATLEERHGLNFELVAIVGSQLYWFEPNGIASAQANDLFENEAIRHENNIWIDQLGAIEGYDDVVILDVTASHSLTEQYPNIAKQGIHLISANKVAGAAPTDFYQQVKESFSKVNRHWLYNATVGAGLPINHTVRDLRESGDTVVALSGIFSGTLSWLFQQYDGTTPFAQLVELAWQQGLTEPDPRNDLDGSDVMRKLVILAREAGLDIEPESVCVENLVPEELAKISLDDFFEKSESLSQSMAERLEQAHSQNKVLRYVARLNKQGNATVAIEALEANHPLANLLPCDNIFAIESAWYKDNPLVIRGPGAGKEVTAGAIQSDLNRLAQLI